MTVTAVELERAAGAWTARLYERHARALYGLCVMLLRDRDEAEDALQSTFLAAHGALLRGGKPRDEGAWLAAIARNECRGRLRARMEMPIHDDPAVLDELPDPAATTGERIADPRVRHALAALSESQREAVVLRDVLGLRTREVGELLGLSRPAVEALLFRARRQLRLRLRPVGLLVVPAAVGHALAQAIPGFVAPAAAAGLATSASGAAGAGIIAKLTAAPTAAKVAAGVAAAATAGSVAAVEVTREPASRPAPTPARSAPAIPSEENEADRRETREDESRSSRDDAREDDRSGPGAGEDATEDRSGPGDGRGSADGGSSGPGSGGADLDEPLRTDSSGPGSGGPREVEIDERSDSSGTSGPGSGGSGSSGSSSGSGSSSSGSGSSGSGSGESEELERTTDSSGPG